MHDKRTHIWAVLQVDCWFRFCFYLDFGFAFCVLLPFCSCVVSFCCVLDLVSSSTNPRDWLGRTSPKWSNSCRVGRKTLSQPITWKCLRSSDYFSRCSVYICQSSINCAVTSYLIWFTKIAQSNSSSYSKHHQLLPLPFPSDETLYVVEISVYRILNVLCPQVYKTPKTENKTQIDVNIGPE